MTLGILHTRMRTREKTEFQKNLEKLKSEYLHICLYSINLKHRVDVGRKLKLKDDEGSSDQHDSESESDIRSRRLFKGSRPSGEVESDNSDESLSGRSSDFIVNDEMAVELPPEFSMETHQDLSHQFKKIFQFFVHIAVQPASDRAAYMQNQMQGEHLQISDDMFY